MFANCHVIGRPAAAARALAAVAALAAAPGAARAQAAPGAAPAPAAPAPAPPAAPLRIPAPGGEVVLPDEVDRRNYDGYHFAAVRRVGDMLYLAGVVVGAAPGEPVSADAFKAQTRRAFRRIGRSLAAAGAGFEDVVMLRTYHVWDSPLVPGGKAAQIDLFTAVKDEFVRPPYPAWTAVGVTALFPDRGIVEVEVVARAPRAAP
jgi:enamine deaminase RidA (YjgF/YER057c/UK114 family)